MRCLSHFLVFHDWSVCHFFHDELQPNLQRQRNSSQNLLKSLRENGGATGYLKNQSNTSTTIKHKHLVKALLPFTKFTSSTNPEDGIPEPLAYKEAASNLFRSVSIGLPTTSASYDIYIDRFDNGNGPSMKKAPSIFPEYIQPVQRAGQ